MRWRWLTSREILPTRLRTLLWTHLKYWLLFLNRRKATICTWNTNENKGIGVGKKSLRIWKLLPSHIHSASLFLFFRSIQRVWKFKQVQSLNEFVNWHIIAKYVCAYMSTCNSVCVCVCPCVCKCVHACVYTCVFVRTRLQWNCYTREVLGRVTPIHSPAQSPASCVVLLQTFVHKSYRHNSGQIMKGD